MSRMKIEALLRDLGHRGIERARSGLVCEIKNRIPHRLTVHRMDTVNIMIDLRISRLAATAAIIVAVLVIGSFFGGRDAIGRRMYQDSKLFLKYTLGGEKACKAEIIQGLSTFHADLVAQGREVVYYGDRADVDDPTAILMHWKLSEDKYGVILGNLTPCEVSGELLIMLQARMLQQRAR